MTETQVSIVERLIEAIITDPRSFVLDYRELPRRVNFTAKVSINDVGKVIGKQGAHIKALKLLISTIGAKLGEEWTFAVLDPDDGERVSVPLPDAVASYNPGEATELLRDVIEELFDEDFGLDMQPGRDGKFLTYTFRIRPTVVQDYELLVTQVEIDGVLLNPIAALGTLFRAYGTRQGVAFRVEIPSLKK